MKKNKFDLTPTVVLDADWQKKYSIARTALFILFFCGSFYFTYRMLFPRYEFLYDPSAGPIPKISSIYNVSEQGNAISFDVFSNDNFSDVDVELAFEKKLSAPPATLSAIKTFTSFAYPETETPAAFPDGSLLKNRGNFYLVSNGTMRKFSSVSAVRAFGYADASFIDAADEEISYNPKGDDIAPGDSYPDEALFLIGGDFFAIKNGVLQRFVSQNAFLSRFRESQAIPKEKDFLDKYPPGENPIGFASGSLISFDNAIFVVDGENVAAVDNPNTFVAMGFDWNSVVPADESETGIYPRTNRLFLMSTPHPDGTIFHDAATDRYYLVQNGKKAEIRGQAALASHLILKPVEADSRNFSIRKSCVLEKNFLSNSYDCVIPVAELVGLSGNAYKFTAEDARDGRVSEIETVFFQKINWDNMRDTLSGIKSRILTNYGYAQPR